MDAEEKPQKPQERPLDSRCIVLLVVAVLLAFLAFFVIDNRDSLFAGQARGEQWDRLDSRIVENNCLGQARKVAQQEGYDPLVVLGCSCINVQSDLLKTFDCDVNTVDVTQPARKVIVHCYKTSSTCTIASDRGLETYNFTELEQAMLG